MKKNNEPKNEKIKVIIPQSKAFEYKNEAFVRDISLAALIREKLGVNIENPKTRTRLTIRRVAPLNLMFEIRKIGTNINQIAKHLNQGHIIDEDVHAELKEIKEELLRIGQHDY